MSEWRQPDLLTEWGTPYHGRAQTMNGDLWWHEDEEGKRTPLLPAIPIAGAPPSQPSDPQ